MSAHVCLRLVQISDGLSRVGWRWGYALASRCVALRLGGAHATRFSIMPNGHQRQAQCPHGLGRAMLAPCTCLCHLFNRALAVLRHRQGRRRPVTRGGRGCASACAQRCTSSSSCAPHGIAIALAGRAPKRRLRGRRVTQAGPCMHAMQARHVHGSTTQSHHHQHLPRGTYVDCLAGVSQGWACDCSQAHAARRPGGVKAVAWAVPRATA